MKPDAFDNRKDGFDHGLERRRGVLGDAWVDRATAGATEFNADFQAFITVYAWDAVWNRPGLDTLTRRLLVVAFTMAQGRWEEFELHTRAALASGVTPDQVKEVLMQGAIYAGVPAANTGFKITARLLDELGLKPAAAPLVSAVRPRIHTTFSQPQLSLTLQGEGDKVPIVFAHALGLDASMWEAMAGELASQGHPTLRYDQRGHGRSPAAPGAFSMDDLADDAARIIAEWGRGPVVFIGLSLGGMVGQGLALRHPQSLRGLVLANTTAQYPLAGRQAFDERIALVLAQGMAAVTPAALERFFSPGFANRAPQVVAAISRRLLSQAPAPYAQMCAAVREVNYLDRLGAVVCPTLVMTGANDLGTPPAMGQALAQRIPVARWVDIANAAHLGVLEQPGAYATEIGAFLAPL